MKKKIKLVISSLFIFTLALYNVNFILDKGFSDLLLHENIEALASPENGEGWGTKYQIQAGCNGESFAHFKQHCCRGTYFTCVEACPNGVIYSGCSTHGRLPL